MITTSVKVGVTGSQQQPIEYGRRTDGRYTIVPYESLNINDIATIAINCESLGLQYEVKQTFGKWRIDVHYNYNWAGSGDPATEMIEKWESVPLKTEKSILTGINSLTFKVINAGNGYQLDLVRQFIEKGSLEDLIDIDADTGVVSFTPPASVTDNNAILLLKYYFDGQRT